MRTTPSSKTTPPVTSLTFWCAPPRRRLAPGEKNRRTASIPLDRCKDIEVGSEATVYATLTNYAKHDTFYGQILRISEDSNDPEAEKPTVDVYSPGSTDAEA
jgi:secreted PhoX family phosphatase